MQRGILPFNLLLFL